VLAVTGLRCDHIKWATTCNPGEAEHISGREEEQAFTTTIRQLSRMQQTLLANVQNLPRPTGTKTHTPIEGAQASCSEHWTNTRLPSEMEDVKSQITKHNPIEKSKQQNGTVQGHCTLSEGACKNTLCE
jgi:hypothetical protein